MYFSYVRKSQSADRQSSPKHRATAAGADMLNLQIIGSHQGEKTVFNLIVGEIQQEGLPAFVVILDGEIAALVNHRQRIFLSLIHI